MDAKEILILFIVLRLVQQVVERALAWLNRRYWLSPEHQQVAKATLGISDADFDKTLRYTQDKFSFGSFATWMSQMITLVFLAWGGLGALERLASAWTPGPLTAGIAFFGLVGLASMLSGLPFEYYRTFVIEARHGFNRQTVKGFWLDRLKGIALAVVLGAPLLAGILWIMAATGDRWWLWAWAAMSGFSLFTAWAYPTFLAPLFNKFSPVEEGELKHGINALAARIGFRAAGIYVMDASKRSSHGNAYFTGVFGKKRIVLFDTLVTSMAAGEVVAVLAHELGHFKLHHVRWGVLRGILMTGVTFYLLSRLLPFTAFYRAFDLGGVSNHGALIVFGLWFSVLDFLLAPIGNWISRKNEFAADRFAREHAGGAKELGAALLKLRETSHAMPLTHPLFSAFYHSHPPLLERLAALGLGPQTGALS